MEWSEKRRIITGRARAICCEVTAVWRGPRCNGRVGAGRRKTSRLLGSAFLGGLWGLALCSCTLSICFVCVGEEEGERFETSMALCCSMLSAITWHLSCPLAQQRDTTVAAPRHSHSLSGGAPFCSPLQPWRSPSRAPTRLCRPRFCVVRNRACVDVLTRGHWAVDAVMFLCCCGRASVTKDYAPLPANAEGTQVSSYGSTGRTDTGDDAATMSNEDQVIPEPMVRRGSRISFAVGTSQRWSSSPRRVRARHPSSHPRDSY